MASKPEFTVSFISCISLSSISIVESIDDFEFTDTMYEAIKQWQYITQDSVNWDAGTRTATFIGITIIILAPAQCREEKCRVLRTVDS